MTKRTDPTSCNCDMPSVPRIEFRKFEDGEVIALFNDEWAPRSGLVDSYMHNGQHGAAEPGVGIPASPEEYDALLRELTHIYGAIIVVPSED